jgi:hypothetical protein
MKNAIKLIGIALIAVIGFSMTACPTDGGDGGGGSTNANVPGVNQLPDFPAGSTPATTKADAEAALAKLRQSTVMESLDDEAYDVLDEYRENSGNSNNYSFIDKSLPNGYVKVSYSVTGNTPRTGGFKAYYDLQDTINALELEDDYMGNYDEIRRLEEEQDAIQFANNDKDSSTYAYNQKAEVTRDKTEDGVTIAKGSMREFQDNISYNITVVTPGTLGTVRISGQQSIKQQAVKAYTITTSSGSVKIIFDVTMDFSYSVKNILWGNNDDDESGTSTMTSKYSGSLKVYGKNNALLIDHRINNNASYEMAMYMIGYERYPFNPVNVTPLTSNTAVDGNIATSGSVAWYSINVTKGTKYYLWLEGELYGELKVYYSNGDNYLYSGSSSDGDSSFTATSTGKVYIMVHPEEYGSTGTFSIVYNTSGNKPFTLNGRWVDSHGMTLVLNSGNWEYPSDFMKGTYTTSGNNITMTVTHIHGGVFGLDSKWYSKTELKSAVSSLSDAELNEIFTSQTGTYSASGNTITIISWIWGEAETFTRR